MKESKFKFKIPYLKKIFFQCNRDYDCEEIELNIKATTAVRKNQDEATVSLDMEVFELEKIKEAPYYINIIMEGDFTWSEDLEEDKINDLLRRNAPSILLSYIRPYLSNLTTGAGYPPLILPLLDFTENEAVFEAKKQD